MTDAIIDYYGRLQDSATSDHDFRAVRCSGDDWNAELFRSFFRQGFEYLHV